MTNENEINENVCRCRMDIQELKGMMKMHFKDEVHHHSPCKVAAEAKRNSRFNGTLICVLAFMFFLCGVDSCLTTRKISRLENRQNEHLNLLCKEIEEKQEVFNKINEVFLNHKQVITTNWNCITNEVFERMADDYRLHTRLTNLERAIR